MQLSSCGWQGVVLKSDPRVAVFFMKPLNPDFWGRRMLQPRWPDGAAGLILGFKCLFILTLSAECRGCCSQHDVFGLELFE